MSGFSHLLQQGAAHTWLFFPIALVLGALHGLEPGHSKTMMAAFIVAIRGTIGQAVLLGISAAVSHSLVIWVLAALALNFGSHWNAESTEPYFQLASAVIVAGLALWMFWRTRQDIKAAAGHSAGRPEQHGHEFEATLRLAHGDHAHTYTVPFHEVGHHHHEPGSGEDFEDAHERAHALEIQRRFGNRNVTTGQIVVFGLAGGLMPCPAAFSILVICLQIKQVTLGFALVLAFSVGLALTLVATGSLAAWSVRQAERRFKGFGTIARKLPYVSSAFLLIVALYMGAMGWKGLTVIQ
jgi:nickel/cobalt transporter (NicO) family protein